MKKIIIFLIAFLIISFTYLSYIETRQQSPSSQNWWVVYFSDPRNESLNFVIENNSNETNFRYDILSGENKLKEVDIKVAKGEKKDIPVENINNNEKVIIRVIAGNEKKEIYKIF